jgi:putative xylitol transport system ATP-binding protein
MHFPHDAKTGIPAEVPNGLLLRASGIAKSFSGVPALRDGRLSLRHGSVHALCGGNGAGKSTFLNILMGILPRDAGSIQVNGQEVIFQTPKQALQAGISIITQELSPVPGMTVAENLYLGREPKRAGCFVNYRKLNRQATALLEELRFAINPRRQMRQLSLAETQLIEIAKALTLDARIIIMDEPTSAIGEHEAHLLFDAIRRLTGLGKGIIYVSHRMTEIFEIADDYTVFRDGAFVESGLIQDIDRHHLIRQIIGRELNNEFRAGASLSSDAEKSDVQAAPAFKPEQALLHVRELSCPGKFEKVNLTLHPGEVVGIYGLLGSGRSEFLQALFGLEQKVTGKVSIQGREVLAGHPQQAMRYAMALVTEDRKASGLVLPLSVRENISLSSLPRMSRLGFINKRQETAGAKTMVDRLRVRTASLELPVRNLSGGNQQKVVLARWVQTKPKILLLDEPTRGIDEGAKHEIYAFMTDFIGQGGGIVMVSSEVHEVMGMSDRIIVFRKGRVSKELVNHGITQEELIHLAS